MSYYPLALEPDDNGTFLVTCPALPEVTSFGDTEAEAMVHGTNAVLEAVAARVASGRATPSPRVTRAVDHSSPVAEIPFWADMKVRLCNRMAQANVTRAELARRMNVHREQVDRLFRLDHASRPEQMQAAFAALGAGLRVEVVDRTTGQPLEHEATV